MKIRVNGRTLDVRDKPYTKAELRWMAAHDESQVDGIVVFTLDDLMGTEFRDNRRIEELRDHHAALASEALTGDEDILAEKRGLAPDEIAKRFVECYAADYIEYIRTEYGTAMGGAAIF